MAEREYIVELRDKLKAEAEALSKNSVICNACLKKQIAGTQFAPFPSDISQRGAQLTDAVQEAEFALREYLKPLNEKYRGRIASFKDQEWVIIDITGCGYRGYRVVAYLDRVNKKEPWLTTDDSDTEQTIHTRKAAVENKKKG